MKHEFNNQHKYEARTLHSSEWTLVIEKAQAAPEANLHMFILTCLANSQTISIGTICAFRGVKLETGAQRSVGSTAVGYITKWVRGVTGEEKASFFDWHPISGEWSIGSYQMRSLRTAMKYENSLPLPPKSYAD
jgi:hypothetical protein